MRTLVVIPALNEEDSLPHVLAHLREVVPTFDVLVVDDGSSDGTAAVAMQAGVKVASLPFNLGVGTALRAGFRHAARHGYDRVVQTDADGQHDPSEIGALLGALDGGADMVIGSRFAGTAATYETDRLRRMAMRILSFVIRVLLGRSFSDTSSGFRAFSRPAIELFAKRYPREFLSDTVEALILASYTGLRVVDVPVRMHQRIAGQPSHRSFWLIYHYVRVILAVVLTASREGRRTRKVAA